MPAAPRPMIGLDFDNTVVSYNALLHEVAREAGYIDAAFPIDKTAIRDHVRRLADGERKWQGLQALIYGARIDGAVLVDGVAEFIAWCRARGLRLSIVSLKTERPAFDPNGTELRRAALGWMDGQGFFDTAGFGFRAEDVHFLDDRQQKVRRIAALGCSHFVDDLEEVFCEPEFPRDVVRLLFAPTRAALPQGPFVAYRSWPEITRAIADDLG